MKITTAFTGLRHCFITLTHSYSDPTSWIVKRWTKLMWFKILVSTDCFNDAQQAMAFANKIAHEHHGKEIFHHAE
jgi:hypothetical protein